MIILFNRFEGKCPYYLSDLAHTVNALPGIEVDYAFHHHGQGPVISYIDPEGKERNYFIDFKLKDSNIVFEIKSDYYWNKKIDINLKKMEAASKLYDYYLILNNDFSEIKNLFNEV